MNSNNCTVLNIRSGSQAKGRRYFGLFLLLLIIIFSFIGCSTGKESQVEVTKAPQEESMDGVSKEKIEATQTNEPIDTEEVLEKREPIDNEQITDLLFVLNANGFSQKIPCWLDINEGIYYVFLPSYSTLDTVQISTSNGITIDKTMFEDTEYLSGLDFDEKYNITSFKITGVEAQSGKVIFLKSANMPTVFIDTETGALKNIITDKSYKEKGNIVLVDENGSLEYQGDLDYIKGRGNYTWVLEKKPFNIKLSKATDLFDMGSAKRWSLLSNHTDQSFIRNKLAYEMAKDVGVPFAIDSIFVDLYLNGEYYGLFQLTERVEVNDNRVDITDLEKKTENVNLNPLKEYESYQEIDQLGYIAEKGFYLDNNPDDITGGYLVEVDFYNYFVKELSGFKTDRNTYFSIKSPEVASIEQVSYIKELIYALEKEIYPIQKSEEIEDVLASNEDAYLEYIDLDSWVNVYLIHEIFENFDTFRSSQFFYKQRDIDGELSKIFAGPIWDFDMTMGNISYVENPETLYIDEEIWFGKLYENETFYNRAMELFSGTYLPLLKELTDNKIDEYETQLTKAAKMNFVRWPLPDFKTNYNSLVIGTFEGNIDYIKDYLTKRIEFLTDIWINEQGYYHLIVRDTFDYPMRYMVKEGEVAGELAEPEIQGEVYEGWFYLNTDIPFDPNKPIFEDTDIYAKQTKISDMTYEQLNDLGYDLKTSPDLYTYLKILEHSDYTVFISVKDEATFSLNKQIVEQLHGLGLEIDLLGQTGISYVAAVKGGVALNEEAEYKILTVSGQLDNGSSYEISSSSEDYNHHAKIFIDGIDYSVDSRGLNFVVYDESTGQVVDSVCFDTYWSLNGYVR